MGTSVALANAPFEHEHDEEDERKTVFLRADEAVDHLTDKH
jgi:hypothetical protein